MGRLEGKYAFITGTTSGIGLASAKRFSAEGATIFGADIKTHPMKIGRQFETMHLLQRSRSWMSLMRQP